MLPVEVGLEQCQLAADLDWMKGHEIELLTVSWFTEVPLNWRGGVLESDAVTGHAHLHLFLPLDDLCD